MPAVHNLGCSRSWFPEYHGRNVTFVMGSLEGDPVKLNLLKNYVSKALHNIVNNVTTSLFNIIYFSCEITKWCNCAVRCNPDTIAQATSWVQSLVCDSGASTTDALTAAFEDRECQSVYLVIDALPGTVLQGIYSLIGSYKNSCSVTVIYLLGEPSDSQTEGSFKMINLKPSGSSSTVTNDGRFHSDHCCMNQNLCRKSPTLYHELRELPLPCYSACKKHSAEFTATSDSVHLPLEALCLFRGARVLARRETDGFYYLGHIVQEVEGSKDRFLVEFEKCRSLKGKAQFRMQETQVGYIIHYEDARWRPLSPGDHVLAPLESNIEQYAPGTVLQGSESRERSLAFESNGVLVTFWNGKTKRIPPGMAVWISQRLCDHIILELHIPLDTRRKLVQSYSGYPFPTPLGYRPSSCPIQEALKPSNSLGSHSCLYCGPEQGVCLKCHMPEEPWAAFQRSLNQVYSSALIKKKAGKGMGKQKVLQQDVSYQEKTKKKSTKVPRKESHFCNRGLKNKMHPGEHCSQGNTDPKIGQCSPIKSELKYEGSLPNISYRDSSPNSTGHMTHLQKTLHSIEKAMKEDRLALEAAVRERRPRTTPLILKHDLKAQKSQELKDQKEAAKMNHLRIQAEQRVRSREEKMQNMEYREYMLQDSRRLQSEQRLQLEVERKQDQEGLAAQIAETRRAAAEERYKKQEEAAKAELIKEQQKIKFWTDHRKQKELQELKQIQENHQKEENRKELLQDRMINQARKKDSDIQQQHQNQQLKESARRRVSKQLEQFYREVEQESQKDKELQHYLKERNLQTLRSAKAL
ncbi:G- coupled receptor 113 [Pelobates cultripes]|uniref:G- coupled receptor 113 n=1 Tax=Pelobates cultripes TaxID=61616 RepID=A0AAD1W0Q6_PELCU|nr:G- coupled receptor 113 [Pelobates cultripes]